MTYDVFHDFWDEEMRALSKQVAVLFGVDASYAAIDRARLALSTSKAESILTVARIRQYRDALKSELRRLITPQ
jgi:hypothetical protein